jgi:DNA replication protein DnaC
MGTTDQLIPVLKKLRLSGVLDSLDLRLRQAVEDDLSHSEFLYRLFSDEAERREAKQLALRLRRASFEQEKSIEEFEFAFNPKLPKSRLIDLATCGFVAKKASVILIGPAGVGKSHIAQALGNRACRAGYNALYVRASSIFEQLRAARADNGYERKLTQLAKADLLIIDDLGLRPLKGNEPEDLYEIISRRYERGAMVITSNRAVEEWYPLFGDPLLASAAMDRLLHYAEVLVLEGESYRNPARIRRGRDKRSGE